ncbi:putative cp2 transcription factor [Phaeomoniella chlamydospora]|uniref:Putative cp2 transcription factor n=1 Tax=Phaeomoniella chlamydospora TaxID=158046 RepID=A0A0G2DZ27_PHACM|nr:putative cp2 transcription factor [Phaeomoniella chlamydospora]
MAGISESTLVPPSYAMGEKFRYHVTLSAPTAMIKNAEEIPISYLNKGQAYTMSVIDTTPLIPPPGPVRYRTFVRVSFEDEQQRSKPSACWQLWKEGRGTNEAHQRGGKLLAVEYVDPNQGGDDSSRKPQIELESASFDGFCVTWSPNPMTGGADCAISVRFNFLSTDFSHSKGVKGIPVRLCAKTEMLSSSPSQPPSLTGEPEVCFCKVKLFRDHGAERKLSNDVAHVKKTIEKLKQQVAQAESGMGSFGKRKRSGSMVKTSMNRPGKVMKHKRTWSVDSDNDGTSRPSAEEDLHMKLATMQDMFSSTRPVSILFLKGDPEDDPDRFPVQLLDGSETIGLMRTQTWESKQSPGSTPVTSNVVSPTASSNSLPSVNRSVERKQSTTQGSSHRGSMDWSQPQSPERSTKVPKRASTGVATGFLNAVGVDTSYMPPPERTIKPVACFYIALRQPNSAQSGDLYRAIYLMQRSVKDLINGICGKLSVDPTRVTSLVRVTPKSIKIVIDEDVMSEVPEGQDMFVELHDAPENMAVKHESLQQLGILPDGDMGFIQNTSTERMEMRLFF